MKRGETRCFLLHNNTTPTAALQENFFYPSKFYLSFNPQDAIPKVEELGTYSVGIYVPDFYQYLILSTLYFQNSEQQGNKLWKLCLQLKGNRKLDYASNVIQRMSV